MTDEQIISSLSYYFSENYAGDADWKIPHRFDPEAQDITEWAAMRVDVHKPFNRRRGGKKQIPFTIFVECWSRSNTDLYGAAGVASAVKAVFEDVIIDIKDFSDSSEPLIGVAPLDDPTSTDETDEQGNAGWQHHRVQVRGIAHEI